MQVASLMGRIAGDSDTYELRLCRIVGGVKAIPTQYGVRFTSSTTVINNTLGIPAGAMSYHGFREGMKGLAAIMSGDPAFASFQNKLADLVERSEATPEAIEELLKDAGFTPNTSRDLGGKRGTKAHLVVECLAEGWRDIVEISPTAVNEIAVPSLRDWAEALAMDEERTEGTRYGWGAIEWWDKEIQPAINNGSIVDIISELPVFSVSGEYAGTLDVAILWNFQATSLDKDVGVVYLTRNGWEIVDVKTHKPASGFTKEGSGPGYDSDAAQIRSYRDAVEEIAANLDRYVGYDRLGRGAKTTGQRTVVLRDRAYKGKSYLEDRREVPSEMFMRLRAVDDDRKNFERGAS